MIVVAAAAMLVPAGSASANGTNTCKFDMFPTAPGGSSELAVGCFLTTAVGGAGNKYIVEDFPQAKWHSGSARNSTNTVAVAIGGKTITSATAHFGASDINNGISGTGIPGNDFIVAVGVSGTSTTATLALGATAAIPVASKQIIENSDGRTMTDVTFSGTTMTSPTAHFCKAALGNCGTKTDVGKVVAGTQVSHLATITAVTSATVATISTAAIACPAGVPAADCKQVSLSLPSTTPATTTRQIKDATFVAPNKVCSATAGFGSTDVQLAITSVGTVQKFPAADYITAAGTTTGCPGGTTGATLHANFVATGTNASVLIGAPNASAPANGTTVAQLNSELSVNPLEAPGEPACTSNILVGSALAGKWNNPGSFDPAALGAASAVTTPGPVIAQIDYITGQANIAAYVVQVKASTAGESDLAAHYDIYFPLLITGVAVCPAPNTAGVATTFRFNGQTLLSSATGAPGDARDLFDFATGSHPGTAYEHILKTTTSELNTSGACTVAYPPVNGFACGGN